MTTSGKRSGWFWRMWRYSLIVVVNLVIAGGLIAGLELALRAAKVGVPVGLFVERTVEGQPYRLGNPQFYQRFFTTPVETYAEEMEWLLPEKQENAYRIFVFGGSAIFGTHDFAFGPCRMLEVMLEHAYPGLNAEVLVVAQPTMNSTTMRDAVRYCAAEQPDLFLGSMGSNEVIGPFGGINLRGGYTPWSDRYVRMRLLLSHSRLVQLAFSQSEELWKFVESPDSVPHFTPGDARLVPIRQRFESNLHDIVACGLSVGASVALMTEPVNLEDFFPVLSTERVGLEAGARAAWREQYDAAVTAQEGGELGVAQEGLEACLKVDPEHAETHFRLGMILLEQGRNTEALSCFRRACDLDSLPIRATTAINEVVERVAAAHRNSRVVYMDMATRLNALSPSGICGEQFISDNCHYSVAGAYAVARQLAEQIGPLIPATKYSGRVDTPLTFGECKRLLGCSEAAELETMRRAQRVFEGMEWRAPRELTERIAGLEARVLALGPDVEIAAYREALQARPSDPIVHGRYVKELLKGGRLEEGEREADNYLSRHPYRREAWRLKLQTISIRGDVPGAAAFAERFLRVFPDETGEDVQRALAAWNAMTDSRTERKVETGAAEAGAMQSGA